MKFLILFSFLISGCFNGFHRECPNTMNVSWKQLPATIKINNLDPGESSAFEQSVQYWNEALGKEYIRIDPNSKNLVMNGGIDFNDMEQGKTTVNFQGIKIVSANIYVRPNLSRNIDLESLYVHELGHFLGLDHNPGTVMDSILPNFVYQIEIDQKVIDSVKCLYENR